MSPVDTIGMIGELIAWFGVIVGLPLLAVALLIRVVEGPRHLISVTVIEVPDQERVAIWTVGQRTYSRTLAAHEQVPVAADGTLTGFVLAREPDRLALHRRHPADRFCMTMAITMISAAVVGFLTSLLPLFW